MVPVETRRTHARPCSRSSPGLPGRRAMPLRFVSAVVCPSRTQRKLDSWNDAVLIRRGLRGVLARKRRDPDVRIPFDEVAAVRFAPSGWLVGYLQVIERGASVGSRGYLTTIRDHRTVTFLTRSGRWGRAAEEVAARSDVIVEVESAPHYWGGVLAAAGRRRRR